MSPPSRRRFASWLVPLAVFAELASASPALAASQKQVLVLYSTRRDAQIVILGERDLPRQLEAGLGAGVDYYSEYLDQGRFPDADYQTTFRDFLRKKYSGLRFDVVIAMQDTAGEFVRRNRELFDGTPIVFFADTPNFPRPADSTIIVGNLNFGGTVSLARALQPEIRNVFVVTGTSRADRNYEDIARQQLGLFEPGLAITFLAGLPTAALEARLASLPAQSIVYYLLVDEDGAGEKFHPLEYLERVAAAANAPTYCWVDSAMGRQIVGGSLKDQAKQIEAVGDLALRVLGGEPADGIPILSPDLNVNQVDWRQMQRWGISEARLPAGTLVRFREPSVWDRYKLYIAGAFAVLLGQTALIVGLLVQRTRRRQAEDQARGSQTALQISFDRIRDLGARLLNAQEDERARIARELHDDISQQLALLSVDLELLRGGAEPPVRAMVGEVLSRAEGLAHSVHDLSHRLHPARLRLIGLVAALQGLQRELPPSGPSVSFTHHNVPANLPADLTLCLFRIGQEALQNAVKHSQARHVSVEVRGSAEGVAMTIADDGVGFEVDPAIGTGLGLISMDERIEAVGGRLAIRSSPGAGTRLEVVVPLHPAGRPAAVPV